MSTFAADNFNLIPGESGKKSFLDKAKELVSDKSGSVKDKIFGVFSSWSFAANKLPSDFGPYPAGGGNSYSYNQDPDNEPPRRPKKKKRSSSLVDITRFYPGSDRDDIVERYIIDHLDLDDKILLDNIIHSYSYYKAPSRKRKLVQLIAELKSTEKMNYESGDVLLPQSQEYFDSEITPLEKVETLPPSIPQEDSDFSSVDVLLNFDEPDHIEELSLEGLEELEELSIEELEGLEEVPVEELANLDDENDGLFCSSPIPAFMTQSDTEPVFEPTTQPQAFFKAREEDANLIGIGNPTPDGEEGSLSLIASKRDEFNQRSQASPLSDEVREIFRHLTTPVLENSYDQSDEDEKTTIEFVDSDEPALDSVQDSLNEGDVLVQTELNELEENQVEDHLSSNFVEDNGSFSFTYTIAQAIKLRLKTPEGDIETDYFNQLLIKGEILPQSLEEQIIIDQAQERERSGTVMVDVSNEDFINPELANLQVAGLFSRSLYRSKAIVKSGWNSLFGQQKTKKGKVLKLAATVGLMAGASMVAPVSVPMTLLAPAISTAIGVTSFWSMAEARSIKNNDTLTRNKIEILIDSINHARYSSNPIDLEGAITNYNKYIQDYNNRKETIALGFQPDFKDITLNYFDDLKAKRKRSTFKRALSYSLIAQTVTAGLLEYSGVTDHIASITSYFSGTEAPVDGVIPSNGGETVTAGTEAPVDGVVPSNGGEAVTAGTENSVDGDVPSNGGEAVTAGTEAPVDGVVPSNGGEAVTAGTEAPVDGVVPSNGGEVVNAVPEIPSNGVQLSDETFIADFKNIEGNLTASDSIVRNGVYEINTASGTSIYARDAAGEKISLFMDGARLKATGNVELFTDSEGTKMQFMEVMYKGKAYLVSKLHMMKV